MSGFQYQVYLAETKDKGKGIFTKEFIPKGSLVWTLTNTNHVAFSPDEVAKHIKKMSLLSIKFFLNHIYCWKGNAILCTDEAEYVNHSSEPNLCESEIDERKGCWALKDIQPNEELLDSYKSYETPQWYLNLCKKYEVESSLDVSEKYK